MPSQSPRSLALASAVLRPTMRMWCLSLSSMKRTRDTITSMMGPRSAPSRWISSMMITPTFCTYSRFCHCRLTPSHFSGVVTMMSARCTWPSSGAESPDSSITLRCKRRSNFSFQSSSFSRTSDFSGPMYTAFSPLCSSSRRITASSATTVLPEPVGAHMRMLSSVWYDLKNTCVCTALKCVNR